MGANPGATLDLAPLRGRLDQVSEALRREAQALDEEGRRLLVLAATRLNQNRRDGADVASEAGFTLRDASKRLRYIIEVHGL